MVARDFFAFMNLYDFLYENCLNLLKNPTVKGLKAYIIRIYRFSFTSSMKFGCVHMSYQQLKNLVSLFNLRNE